MVCLDPSTVEVSAVKGAGNAIGAGIRRSVGRKSKSKDAKKQEATRRARKQKSLFSWAETADAPFPLPKASDMSM